MSVLPREAETGWIIGETGQIMILRDRSKAELFTLHRTGTCFALTRQDFILTASTECDKVFARKSWDIRGHTRFDDGWGRILRKSRSVGLLRLL
jgi:hypothetical protein